MRHLSAWFVVLLFVTAQAFAQATAEKPWVSLFDGTDLSGWKTNGAEKWVVDDGAILGESTAGKYGYLTTEKTYRDFNLRLRFKCETNGNSGVFTRSRITGDSPKTGPDIVGMQVEVDPTRHTGGIYESGGRGWVALPTPEGERAIKPRDWNDLEILAHHSAQWRSNCGLHRSGAEIYGGSNRATTAHRRRSQDPLQGHLYSGARELN
jgi:hypothetical protein